MATNPPENRTDVVENAEPTPRAWAVVRNHPIKLQTPDEIRLEMARVYREMRAGKLESQQGTRLVYVLGELRKAYETCVIDRRLTALEG
jgi:hypothetical protein